MMPGKQAKRLPITVKFEGLETLEDLIRAVGEQRQAIQQMQLQIIDVQSDIRDLQDMCNRLTRLVHDKE